MKDYILRKFEWHEKNQTPQEDLIAFFSFVRSKFERESDHEFVSVCVKKIKELAKKYNIEPSKIERFGYKDLNDYNHLHWGGKRSDSHIFSHPMQMSPMFFRRNGSPIDLINIYNGKSIFVICNGPSFAEVDHYALKRPGIVTMGINNGGHIFRPNLWTCVDDPTRFLGSIWDDPTITKFVPLAHFEKPIWDNKKKNFTKKLVGDYPCVVGYRRNEKFDAKKWLYEDTVNWGNHKDNGGGRSVMVSTLRLCHLLGFKNVYLLGCDFIMDENNKYFFDEERTKGAISNNNTSYQRMTEYFKQLQPIFEHVGFNVYNLNPNSNLEVFRYKKFDDCIKAEETDLSDSTHGMYIDPKKRKEMIDDKK